MMRVFGLILTICLSLGLPAGAQDARLKSLESSDMGRGWEAVGRLNLGTRGFCTGALIAPDQVLTAGHCLFDKETGARIDPTTIEFLAGWRNGRAVAYRRVKRAVAHPDYVYSGGDLEARVPFDVALLQLDQPIRLPSVQPYDTAPEPRRGAQVGVVSYARDRAEAPSLQEVCEVLARRSDMLMLSCDVDFGSSGAPIFSLEGGVARVVSVVSAKAEMDGRKVALGTALEAPLAVLRAALLREEGPLRASGASVLRGGAAGAGTAGGGGAKFLRPGG